MAYPEPLVHVDSRMILSAMVITYAEWYDNEDGGECSTEDHLLYPELWRFSASRCWFVVKLFLITKVLNSNVEPSTVHYLSAYRGKILLQHLPLAEVSRGPC